MRWASLLVLCMSLSVGAAAAQTPAAVLKEGEGLYADRCAMCHEAGVPRAANREALSRLTPDAIQFALTKGSMSAQGSALTAAQIDALARTLGTAAPAAAATDNSCPPDLDGFRESSRTAALERVGRQSVPTPLSTGGDGTTAGQSGSATETEMGVRFPRREPSLCAADCRGRARVRWKRQPHGVLAQRGKRVPVLGVQDGRPGTNRHHDRTWHGKRRQAVGRVLRRPGRQRVRGRCAHRGTVVEASRSMIFGERP